MKGLSRAAVAALLATVIPVVPALAQSVPNAPTGPIETKYYANGPFATTQTRSAAPCDSKGNQCDIFYPSDVTSSTTRWPLVVWANGTAATPDKYTYWLRHLASWGFVIVATRDQQTGFGNTALDSLAYMQGEEADPASPFYHRIDFSHVGAAGHSQGASGAANAMFHSNGVISTAVVFHPADNCLLTPTLAGGAGSIFYVSGTADGLIAPDTQGSGTQLNSQTAYYNATPAAMAKAKGLLKGTNHNDISGTPGCGLLGILQSCNNGTYGYLGFPTAWLVWKLKGDAAAGAAFKAGSGEFFTASAWTGQVSNVP
jgi:Chlorophyllase enzyme